MSKIFQQTFADLGVAADKNFMARPDWIQPSVSIIKLLRSDWTPAEITKISVKLKGNATTKDFTATDIANVTVGAQLDLTAGNAAIKSFLDANVHSTMPKTKADVETAATNFSTATLDKFIKISSVAGNANEMAIFCQGAATTNSSNVVNNNTMVESITIEINAANDNALIASSSFTPCTNFLDANTSRIGTTITL